MRQQRLNYASVLSRGGAWLIDGVVIFVAALALLLPLFFAAGGPETQTGAEGLAAILGLTLSGVYYIGSEAKWGQTPGKMVVGIKVVYTDGRECDGAGAVLRNITKIFGGHLISLIVALVLIASTEHNQRLGDLLGETTVVRA